MKLAADRQMRWNLSLGAVTHNNECYKNLDIGLIIS